MVSAYRAFLFSVFLLVLVTYETQAQNALIGEQCSVDRNCITPLTICGNGVCSCFRGHNPTDDRRSCVATTTGLCFDNSDCRSLQFSNCLTLEARDGICTCGDGYVPSRDQRRCLPAANFQGSCEATEQCALRLGVFSLCNEGRCQCQAQSHFFAQEQRCIRSAGLGGACDNTGQCAVNGSALCQDARCVCGPGHVEDQGQCRAGAQNVVVSGAVFLLYWIIKAVIT